MALRGQQSFTTTPPVPAQCRVAVIGSGPAGFYTAHRAMAKIPGAKVDMYEALPVPFGLVRFGVAPDHPEVKNCQERFEEVASSPDFTFIGNVSVGSRSDHLDGSSISLASILRHYHAVVFAYGASKDRTLGIPGEDLDGVYSARAFVGWYNGLPEYADLAPDLTQGDEAVIIGQGNVALDVARMLLEDVDVLRKSDIAAHAVETLAKSRIKRVHIVGRRGPMQAAFTIKEIRELMKFPSAFLPASSLPTRLSAAEFERTTLSSPFDPNAYALGAGATAQLPCAVAFRSIGYKSTPLPEFADLGIPFDDRRGVMSNDGHGRVQHEERARDGLSVLGSFPGLYCAGWVKRGPTGVIASTMQDAFDTADAMAGDWAARGEVPFLNEGREVDGWEGVRGEQGVAGARVVSWEEWRRIDGAERERGREVGKEREKFVRTAEMLAVLG
ncbi:NADPH:adrenodoxin oxidoreductase-like protein [Schizothecium vesticola]|uniref:NADPH:adrenodoxin oxidoreductase, mitochondrial n=1 Tax=Schizothecium vesticola TaxID=314040 RepID=A0AA40EQF9_9PEZI|nr:NADPH:adrenodoxin oxidoreductase-like protein [Schizothecium vesticola]